MSFIKHEIISCDRCGREMECRANSYTRCDCSKVSLTIGEVQWIAEHFDACLCPSCLLALKEEFRIEQEL